MFRKRPTRSRADPSLDLTRVLQRLGVAEDQARVGIDLGLRNRPLLDVESGVIHQVLAIPPVYSGRNRNVPSENKKPYSTPVRESVLRVRVGKVLRGGEGNVGLATRRIV